MSSRNWFALGARLLGLWVLYRGFDDLLHVGSAAFNINPESIAKQWDSTHRALMYETWFAAGFLAFAFYLMFAAERFARWVYGGPSDASGPTLSKRNDQ